MIYLIGPEDSAVVKIGHTINKPSDRLGILQIGNPVRLVVRWAGEGDLALERHLHAVFKDSRVRGEWFDLSKYSDPVQAVKDEITKAEELLARGEILQVGDRYRDKGRLSSSELAALSGRASSRDYERAPSTLWKIAPPIRREWEELFPPVCKDPERRLANKELPKPGCIRVWQGRCMRPNDTTCDC